MKLPGSKGEHQAQEAFGTTRRALTFYNKQMLVYLNPLMREFIARQEMVFIATTDAQGCPALCTSSTTRRSRTRNIGVTASWPASATSWKILTLA